MLPIRQEEISEQLYNCFFVDLFVRASNKLAQMMYGNLGYTVYRQVLGYYSGENSEDAYGKSEQLDLITSIQKSPHSSSSEDKNTYQ